MYIYKKQRLFKVLSELNMHITRALITSNEFPDDTICERMLFYTLSDNVHGLKMFYIYRQFMFLREVSRSLVHL